MEQYKIIVSEHVIDDRLQGFDIMKKPSSNIDYYGTDENGTVFIQFKNGVSYLYPNVSKEEIKAMLKSESIGKFVVTVLRKYACTKVVARMVNQKEQLEEED
jgi:hypothetical protein